MWRVLRRCKAFCEALGWVVLGNILLTPMWGYIGGQTLRFWTIRMRVIFKQKNFIK